VESNEQPSFLSVLSKIVLFNKPQTAVLAAKRKGEADFDSVILYWRKLETTDNGIRQFCNAKKAKKSASM
jgi:hypothetical protein